MQNFSCSALLRCRLGCLPDFAYGAVTLSGRRFHVVPLSVHRSLATGPITPMMRCHIIGLGSSAFARHYWRNHCCFLFLRVLRCFSSPGWPLPLAGGALCSASGCPIRTSAVMAGICPLPRLFAACHVLLRLREPRHPSCALLSFPLAFKEKSPFYAFRLVVDTSLARVFYFTRSRLHSFTYSFLF